MVLADATLEYARQLDRGIEPRDTSEMFDCRIDAVITEPRDTRVEPDSSTHNKVDTIVAQAHDTAKMQAEVESIRANYDALLETSARITTKLREEIHKLRSALELPEASVLLNKLKAKRKKATASLADIEAILDILEE
jgi:hypothetical protein